MSPRFPASANAPLVAALLSAALLAAGCGSSPEPTSGVPVPAAPPSAGDAPLTVAATDGRVGDATTATRGGVRRLATGPRRIDPDRRPRGRDRRDGVGAGLGCADADLMPDAGNLQAVRTATVCLVNGERQDAGLPPLAWDDRLYRSSLAHSEDMVANGFFAHDSPDGRDLAARIRPTGYISDSVSWTVGENLAWGSGTLATPRAIVVAWMNSPGHRANILRDKYRDVGLGVVLGNPRNSDGGATYTMNFGVLGGDAAGAVPAPDPTLVSTTTDSTRKAAKKRRSARRAAARRAAARKARARKARKARKAAARRAAVRRASGARA